MDVLYINVAEIAIVLMALIILIISEYYTGKKEIKNSVYITVVYFLIVLLNLSIIRGVYLSYAIILQYYLYIFEIYIIYIGVKSYLKKNWDYMGISVFMTVFALLPLLLWYYFGLGLVYIAGKTTYTIIIVVLVIRAMLMPEVSTVKKILLLLFMSAILCLPFTDLLHYSTNTSYTYFAIVIFEFLAAVFLVNAVQAYLKSESEKKNKIYESVYNNSTDAILILNYETIIECNEKALEIFKAKKENLIGNSIVNWSRDTQAKGKSAYESFYFLVENISNEDAVGIDWIFHNTSIEEVASEISIFAIENKQYAMLIRDMSHKYIDENTGFTKREYLKNRLDQLLKKDALRVALLALNIDNFKGINDEFGFAFGDKVLSAVAERLKEQFADSSISRIDGDEFVILLEDIEFLNQIYIYLEKIKAVFSKPIVIGSNSIDISVCVGVLYNSEGERNAGEIINNVDFILNVAKKNGRGSIEFYSKNHKADFANRIAIERDMGQGVKNAEFVPFYQPIVSADTEDIIGAEALVRWRKPNGDILFPDSFISLAEENGMIVDIDFCVLNKACEQCKEMLKMYTDFVVHVNMSGYHFTNDRIVKEIENALRSNDLAGEHLVVEVTETLFVEELDRVSSIVDKIRSLGVKVALDDFGTGYSSLSYLSKVEVDVVKIDRVFILNIPYDEKAKALVEFIISLNKTFDFEVVVEGVEQKVQIEYLKWLDIDYVQGYYYYKPVEFDTIKRLLENNYGLEIEESYEFKN